MHVHNPNLISLLSLYLLHNLLQLLYKGHRASINSDNTPNTHTNRHFGPKADAEITPIPSISTYPFS